MNRIVLGVFVFFVALNGFSWIMIQTGTAEFYGIQAETGETSCDSDVCIEDPDEAEDTNINTGASDGDTLFGQITSAAQTVKDILNGVFPALHMLELLGVPWQITGLIGTLISAIGSIGLVMFLRGYNP